MPIPAVIVIVLLLLEMFLLICFITQRTAFRQVVKAVPGNCWTTKPST